MGLKAENHTEKMKNTCFDTWKDISIWQIVPQNWQKKIVFVD